MDPKRWQRVQELFEAALELDASERSAYLSKACGEDGELRDEVLSLLEADRSGHSLLDGHAAEAVGVPDDLEKALSQVGRQVGPYRIVESLGAGGMGSVYLAERVGDDFEQEVALKLIKRGMDTNEILRRFQAERQILARLEHPNIARLLDGGITEDGLPYFTMEYVDGEPIDEYCDRLRLSVDERLDLFEDVCAAVQHAQRSLVVHRDLKPSNILISKEGVVKLLDFGIAKVVAGDGPETDSTRLTRTGFRLMTPGYGAPEQVRSEPVTTATDVYALGVVLYELLTGHGPYPVRTPTPKDLVEAVLHKEPRRPSSVVDRIALPEEILDGKEITPDSVSRARRTHPARLRKRLRGDLDNIVLKALRKEPERRYSSAEQLLDDLRRHRDGVIVSARPPTLRYRLGKFVRRHVPAVVGTITVMTALIAIVIYYTHRLTDERDRARLEAAKAAEVSEFLTSLFAVADPSESRGEEVTARELLDRGSNRIRSELDDQPEIQATMMSVMGRVYESLGLYREADSLLDHALEIQTRLHGEEDLDVVATLNTKMKVAYALADYETTEFLARKILTLRRNLLEPGHYDIALSLNDLGWLEYELDNYAEATRLHREALDIRRRTFGDSHQFVAESLNNLAVVLQEIGKLDSAEVLHREALAIRLEVLGVGHPETGYSFNNLATLLEEKGELEEAEELYRKGMENDLKSLGEEHPNIATTYTNFARLLVKKEEFAEAESLLHKAVDLDRRRGENHPYVAYDLNELARLFSKKGDLDQAESFFRRAIDIYLETLPSDHGYVSSAQFGLGKLLIERREYEEAETILSECLESRRRSLPEGHPRIGQAATALGRNLTGLSRFAEAEAYLKEGFELLSVSETASEEDVAEAARGLVELYETWGKPEAADEFRDRAREPAEE